MTLSNQTKGTIVTKNLKAANSITDKFFGLLKKKNPRSLLFKTHFGIHTFFLKEPIDVIILNPKKEVVKTATVNINSIFVYNPINSLVVELPKGAINKSKTEVGDTLVINQK